MGSCEREKYAELNEGLLQEMGSIVYSGMSSGTGAAQSYIIESGLMHTALGAGIPYRELG